MMKKQNNSKNTLLNFGRYSGLAFQMMAIILIGVFGGKKLDEIYERNSLFTIIFSSLSVILAIYFAIKDFIKPPKQ